MRLLDLEEEGWRGLLDALEFEAKAVRSQNLEAINDSIQKKGIAINSLSLTLEEKQRQLDAIAQEMQIPAPLNGERLVSHASPEQRQELTKRQEKFAAWAKEVRDKNKENALLIEAALDVVGDSLKFLRRLMGDETHYDRGGNISAQPLQGKIVSERG
ncbi:MAG: flagellar protein FlgN [Syntrophales bacterium]|nr:flagellar protein FlgN [Syntrophales bacterium]